MPDKPNNLNDIDAFWDLDSLLPQKRKVSVRREISTDTVEIELETGSKPSDSGSAIPPRRALPSEAQQAIDELHSITAQSVTDKTRTSPRDEARRLNEVSMRTRAQANEPKPLEPYLVYEPGTSIKRVAVAKWQTKYNFYEKFRTDAHKLWNRTAAECEMVSFFSYIPQYNQLHYAQLKWYLWWRENARHGVWLHTDYSYILLYIYEIINCPDLIEPSRGLELLCDLWLNYRNRYPRIDNYLCEWVCDYCLIYQLPCPAERLEPISKAIVSAASFKEFYMDTSRKTEGAANILAYSSNYDWRTSRYVTKENIGLFSEHIRGAFNKIYREILIRDERISGSSKVVAKPTQIVRDAYNGALCVYDMKRCLTIDYISYTRSPKFRFLVTDIIKYSENRVRLALGIKPRLKVEELTDEMKRCLDEYFDEHLPAPKKAKAQPKQEVNEYDQLYEPTSTTFSLENALNIEKQSWSTTEILTGAFSEDEPESASLPNLTPPEPEPAPAAPAFVPPAPVPDSGADEFAQLVETLSEPARAALRAIADGDAAELAAASSAAGMMPDALADKINETAFDIIGDSIVEPNGGRYRLITDYEGDLIKWLK